MIVNASLLDAFKQVFSIIIFVLFVVNKLVLTVFNLVTLNAEWAIAG